MGKSESTDSDNKKLFSARIDAGILKRVKLLSVNEERSMQDLTEEALRDLLKKYKQ